MSPDGEDYVTDFHASESVEAVWQSLNDMGSRWYFYPMCFVIKDNANRNTQRLMRQRIVDVPDGFIGIEDLRSRTVKTTMTWIKDNPQLMGKNWRLLAISG